MLEKQRNTLIKKAFETAKIIAPGTELTALEIDDAAYTLNCMLQGWSNEGFRLFNMKTGYMPLLSKKNEYKLSTEAYSKFSCTKLLSIEPIGATKIKVNSIKNISKFQQLIVLNNAFSKRSVVNDIDYEKNIVYLETPIDMSVYSGDDVFFGNFSLATTDVKEYVSSFSSIKISTDSNLPVVGDVMYLNFNNSWVKKFVSNVTASDGTVYFTPEFKQGRISKPHVVFGPYVDKTSLKEGTPISPRKLNTDGLAFSPKTISIVSKNEANSMIAVEKTEDKTIILESPVSESVLTALGKANIDGKKKYPSSTLLKWDQIPSDILNDIIDWGSVNDVPASQTVSWGYVSDIVSGKEDFGTLSGSAKIIGFAQCGNNIYVSVKTDISGFLLRKDASGEWVLIHEGQDAKLFVYNGVVYVYNISGGLWSIRESELVNVYDGDVIEHIVEFDRSYYMISKITQGMRVVTRTKDFLSFSDSYSISGDVDLSNAVEFNGKLYCGKNKTYVSTDMVSFYNINIYAENRAVIGNVLQNFNVNEICSYSRDGINFIPMPATTANMSKAANIYGCSFISVYGVVTQDGSVGSQIFSVNEFNQEWTPQAVISGKVFDIYKDSDSLIVVSDTEAQRIKISIDTKTDSAEVCLFGDPIGRPQEIMNVIKYGLKSGIQLSMEALALKDYSQLPHVKADGEPVSYCFFREAKDGIMMVWGTPKKFGEYLKFTYVEPIALLDNAKSVPDIPDEYIGAVIDGLAAELAYEYALPSDKVQILEAKAETSRQMALLHDNEMTSYIIEPNRRGL